MRRFALLCCTLAACASPDPTKTAAPAGEAPALSQSESSLDKHQAYITFLSNGQIDEGNAPIYAGGELIVRYAPNRLPHCRATYNGMPTWSLTGWMKTDVSAPQSGGMRPGGQFYTVNYNIPEDAQEVELWFHNSDRSGCSNYDSQGGENYKFNVSQPMTPTLIRFSADWAETTEGPLLPGGLLQIDYAPERLRSCRATYNGGRTWNIIASWIFQPSGETGQVALYQGDYYAGEAAITQPVVNIPENAARVEMWFSNSDRAGCVDWDSNFNENYVFEIGDQGAEAPPVGWVGNWDFVTFHRNETHLGDIDPAWYWTSMEGSETVTKIDVQVWIPGITDVQYPSVEATRAAAQDQIIAQAISSAHATPWDLEFNRQQGNNFVYSYLFWKSAYQIYNEPAAGPGLYTYNVRVSTDGGESYYETAQRRFVISNQLNCALFPDNAPSECPRTRQVGWVGDWGALKNRLCEYQSGVPEPNNFFKSALGNQCMALTADVWVAGLTDVGGPSSGIRAEVETNLGFHGGPSAITFRHPIEWMESVGNNYRYRWNLSEHVGRADVGEYRYRFRFSADNGSTWYTDGDWRMLNIYNDSTEIGRSEYCQDIYIWNGPYQQSATCIDYQVTDNQDANSCELFVNGFGKGQLSHNQAHAEWIEAYISAAVNPNLVNVGMFLQLDNGEERYQMGELIDPNYFMTGATLDANLPPQGAVPSGVGIEHLAFFADIRQVNGEVTRYWQSAQGANYNLDDLFATQGFILSRGVGSVEYVHEGNNLFAQKWACQ
ncbi:hypothetical protein KKF91_19745 [Myxococcota bacterium]|nr:hypothetical protein [Myxococcota bacterium]MBU1432778.1 hypothetical protein [Myxococcota bacterium]MBU1898851.1 hypothetical protein [Myxococcota bacterium]